MVTKCVGFMTPTKRNVPIYPYCFIFLFRSINSLQLLYSALDCTIELCPVLPSVSQCIMQKILWVVTGNSTSFNSQVICIASTQSQYLEFPFFLFLTLFQKAGGSFSIWVLCSDLHLPLHREKEIEALSYLVFILLRFFTFSWSFFRPYEFFKVTVAIALRDTDLL